MSVYIQTRDGPHFQGNKMKLDVVEIDLCAINCNISIIC